MTAAAELKKSVSYYDRLGQADGVRQLVNQFYDEMDRAADLVELRRMHAADLGPMRHTLFEFLSGWLGGPRTYWDRANAKCMMSAHADLAIHALAAEQWITCMQRALNTLDAESSDRDYVLNAFTQVCRAMVNRTS